MKNKYGSIILSLIILLLLSAASLFLAKDNVASWFDNYENLASLSQPVKISSSLSALDDSVIKSELFKALKNNVNNFNFADICQRPNNVAVVVVSVTNPDGSVASSTPAEDITCRQGNNNPFLIVKKK